MRQIEDDQDYRYTSYREWARYFGADPDVLGGEGRQIEELHQNELANTIETLHAQVFKNNVVPGISTSDANWEEWIRGRAYSRWLEGVFDNAELYYDALPRAGLDTLVYGTGFIKVGHCEDEEGVVSITLNRVDPRMMAVDRLEARGGKPRSLYQKDYVDRFKLMADYCGCDEQFYVPKGMTAKEAAENRMLRIRELGSNNDPDMPIGSRMSCDMLLVREAWHLPSKPGACDGSHAIWIGNCTLVFETFSWKCFPFTVMRHGQRLGGFYGESAVKRLVPTQRQFNKLNSKIDEAQDIMGVPRILIDRGAHIERSHLDDIPGGVIEVDNINGVRDWNATAVSPELYQKRDAAPRKMRSLLGVSDFEVQNQLPQSMREISGPAMERWVDQGSARHAMLHRELERAVVDMAKMCMEYASMLEEEGKDLTVTAGDLEKEAYFEAFLEKGLKAQLQMQSFITGQFLINLDLYPEKPVRLVGIEKRYPEIPTVSSTLPDLAKTLQELPIKELVQKINHAVDSIDQIAGSPELKESIHSLNQTHKSFDRLANNVDSHVGPLASQVSGAADAALSAFVQAEKTLKMEEGAPGQIAVSIKETLAAARVALEETQKAVEGFRQIGAQNANLGYEISKTLGEISALHGRSGLWRIT